MKTWNIFLGICLLVLCMSGLMPAAQAALINNPGQPVLLQGNSGSDTSGILSFTKLNRIKADGTSVPFSMPPNNDIIITWLQFNVNAVDTSLTTIADLQVGPYYSRAMTMNNGAAGLTDSLDPGFIISLQGFSDPRYNNFYMVNLKNNAIIPGTINVRLVGYLAPVR
jgi:hypothetical protein